MAATDTCNSHYIPAIAKPAGYSQSALPAHNLITALQPATLMPLRHRNRVLA